MLSCRANAQQITATTFDVLEPCKCDVRIGARTEPIAMALERFTLLANHIGWTDGGRFPLSSFRGAFPKRTAEELRRLRALLDAAEG